LAKPRSNGDRKLEGTKTNNIQQREGKGSVNASKTRGKHRAKMYASVVIWLLGPRHKNPPDEARVVTAEAKEADHFGR